jgi:phenylacetate-CoA ligase
MNDLYGLMFQKVLYPGWERGVRRRPTLAHLDFLERTEWLSQDELHALQAEQLRALLDHAYNHSPYYRGTMDTAGVHPSDIRSIEDLGKLPLLGRDEASKAAAERMSVAEPLPRIRKMTSGTTGRPLSFAYDVGSEYWRQATRLRGYGWAGYRPGDRALHFWGVLSTVHRTPLDKKIKAAVDHFVRREHYLDCADHSEEALDRAVQQIRRLRPKVIVCYAQAGAALARHVLRTESRDWEDIAVISAAERLFPSDRDAMVDAFGPGVFETYGSREVMLIAAECPAHEGLHVSMENLIVEVIVREGDRVRPAEPGELGEVVVTDLHNYGAPFIRYVNGDLAVSSAPGRCGCGRALSRLQRIEGRQTETLRDGHGKPVGGMFFIVLFSVLADRVRGFQVVQHKDRSIDLKLVPGARFDDTFVADVRHKCARAIPGIDLRTHVVTDIPAGPGGKSRVVVVES